MIKTHRNCWQLRSSPQATLLTAFPKTSTTIRVPSAPNASFRDSSPPIPTDRPLEIREKKLKAGTGKIMRESRAMVGMRRKMKRTRRRIKSKEKMQGTIKKTNSSSTSIWARKLIR